MAATPGKAAGTDLAAGPNGPSLPRPESPRLPGQRDTAAPDQTTQQANRKPPPLVAVAPKAAHRSHRPLVQPETPDRLGRRRQGGVLGLGVRRRVRLTVATSRSLGAAYPHTPSAPTCGRAPVGADDRNSRSQLHLRSTRATGLEPVTFGSVDRCSIQLSYARRRFVAGYFSTPSPAMQGLSRRLDSALAGCTGWGRRACRTEELCSHRPLARQRRWNLQAPPIKAAVKASRASGLSQAGKYVGWPKAPRMRSAA